MSARIFGIALALLAVAGCRETVVSERSEDEVNATLAALARAGVHARKVTHGRDGFGISVRARDLERAVEVLAAGATTANQAPGLDVLYEEPGLMPSAVQERARYHRAVAAELARSLRALEGCRDARVHLAFSLEPASPFGRDPSPPAEASLLLIAEPGQREPLSRKSDAIRRLVAGAVAGLEPDAVRVVVSSAPKPPAPEAPVQVPESRAVLLAASGLSATTGLGLLAVLALRRRERGETEPAGPHEDPRAGSDDTARRPRLASRRDSNPQPAPVEGGSIRGVRDDGSA